MVKYVPRPVDDLHQLLLNMVLRFCSLFVLLGYCLYLLCLTFNDLFAAAQYIQNILILIGRIFLDTFTRWWRIYRLWLARMVRRQFFNTMSQFIFHWILDTIFQLGAFCWRSSQFHAKDLLKKSFVYLLFLLVLVIEVSSFFVHSDLCSLL